MVRFLFGPESINADNRSKSNFIDKEFYKMTKKKKKTCLVWVSLILIVKLVHDFLLEKLNLKLMSRI